MEDEKLVRRPIAARNTGWAASIAQKLTAMGIKPNTISVMSVVFAAGAAACLVGTRWTGLWPTIGLYVGAAACMQGRLLCNLFDGMVAVEGGLKSKSGEIFNDLPDRIADPLILIGMGYAITDLCWGTELGWLAGVLAVFTAYVRVLAGSTGAMQKFLGPMAKQHRMATATVAVLAAAVAAKWKYDEHILMAALGVICLGCLITIARRTVAVVRELEAKP